MALRCLLARGCRRCRADGEDWNSRSPHRQRGGRRTHRWLSTCLSLFTTTVWSNCERIAASSFLASADRLLYAAPSSSSSSFSLSSSCSASSSSGGIVMAAAASARIPRPAQRRPPPSLAWHVCRTPTRGAHARGERTHGDRSDPPSFHLWAERRCERRPRHVGRVRRMRNPWQREGSGVKPSCVCRGRTLTSPWPHPPRHATWRSGTGTQVSKRIVYCCHSRLSHTAQSVKACGRRPTRLHGGRVVVVHVVRLGG